MLFLVEVGGQMTWFWRKAYRFGPFRTTVSNRGWGWSLGVSFLRYGVGPSGTPYVSIGLAGTGLYFTKFLRHGVPRRLRSLFRQPPKPRSSSHHPQPVASPTHLTPNQRILEALKDKNGE
jgi:Protein of unknown function (DUF4236)